MRGFMLALLFISSAATAAHQPLPTPAGSGAFGRDVVFLPNGNFVVTDPQWSGTAPAAGAVYLYTGDGNLISILQGARADDQVGFGGIEVLANGNFVVRSPDVDAEKIADVGAVTFAHAELGFSTAANSPTVAVADARNSLVGSHEGDRVGSGELLALKNGNFIVVSPQWNGGLQGAVTWGDKETGVSGEVSAANSMIGAGVDIALTELAGGDVVVSSPYYPAGPALVTNLGAVTLISGTQATSGTIGPANSILGSTQDDRIGIGGIVALESGHFVIVSPVWDDGQVTDAGAVMHWDASMPTTGVVSSSKALVGSTKNDRVGSGGVIALAGGDYAVASPKWDRDAQKIDVGAVTWGDGETGRTGAVTENNSLVGGTLGDELGGGGLTALAGSGHFVALSPQWDSPATQDVGAATWHDGEGKTVGVLSATLPLAGAAIGDFSFARVVALTNGHYVVAAMQANGVNWANVGAVTWCPGDQPCARTLGPVHSLMGGSGDDGVGSRIVALADGNYVVGSATWDNAGTVDVGAVTWGDGDGGIAGPVTPQNSFIGRVAGDQVGSGSVVPIGSDYLVLSPQWDSSTKVDVGAVTYVDGGQPMIGEVAEANSLYGPASNDQFGTMAKWRDAHADRVALFSPLSNGAIPYAGAVTMLYKCCAFGELPEWSTIRGQQQGSPLPFDVSYSRLVVGDPRANLVYLVPLMIVDPPDDDIFRNGFE